MKVFFAIAASMFFHAVWAQTLSNIAFEETTFNFGEIYESDGPASHHFKFRNDGEAPLRIFDVKASCGCTVPDWSRGEILPRDTGSVLVQFNPANKPGPFRKVLTVTTNAGKPKKYLYIRGAVIPKQMAVDLKFPYEIGNLRFNKKGLNFGKITNEKVYRKDIRIYNASDKTVEFNLSKTYSPTHILLEFNQTSIPSKESTILYVTYDPAKRNGLGYFSDNIALQSNDNPEEPKAISIRATIEEYFPKLSAKELSKAPRLELSDRVYDFGKIDQGTQVEALFSITNLGASDLNIRHLSSNCGCMNAELENYDLKPQEAVILKVTLNTTEERGRQHKSITIFSNDPISPSQTVVLKGEISK